MKPENSLYKCTKVISKLGLKEITKQVITVGRAKILISVTKLFTPRWVPIIQYWKQSGNLQNSYWEPLRCFRILSESRSS